MNKENSTGQETTTVVYPIKITSNDGEISLRQYSNEDAAELFAVKIS